MATVRFLSRNLLLLLHPRRSGLAAITALALAACQRPSTLPPESLPPLGGSRFIAYVSSQRLFVMGTDRSEPVQLTQAGWYVEDFRWSPDGTRIAFKAYVCPPESADCTEELYTIQPDGNRLARLTPEYDSDYYFQIMYFAWSPDGSRIAVSSYVSGDLSGEGDFYDITLLSADGSGAEPRQLFRSDEAGLVLADNPAWSPDGTQIAFDSSVEETQDSNIYLLDVQAGALTRLTDEAGRDWGPTWSPDGARIAFLSDRTGATGIFVLNRDGSNLVQVASAADGETLPQWSPDGSQIAYTADGNRDIYVGHANGSEPVRLTDTPEREWNPTWSPDGQWIMFVGDDHTLYAQAVREPARITLADGLEPDVLALWQPSDR